MNISLKQNIYNLSFQKKLVAKAKILKEGKPSPVQIYHIDKNEDMNALEDALYQKHWDGNFYRPNIIAFCPEIEGAMEYELYTLESNQKTLGCTIIKKNPNNIQVDFLETAPLYSSYSSNRNGKYIGETLLTFLATLAQKEGKDLTINEVADREKTKVFYYTICGFKNIGKCTAKLPYNRLGNLISQNERHTGKQIEIIG